MKSPFPGMDPYIEAQGHLWEDFHSHVVEDIYRVLAAALPQTFVVQSQARAYVLLVETEGKQSHTFVSDVGISATSTTPPPAAPGGSVATAEPTTESEPQTLRAFITEEYREPFLEIYEVEPEWRLVTCIEVLSPSNKRPNTTGWDQYLRKRQGLLMGEANFVEIDLLRGGTRMPMFDPWPKSPYTLLVARREKAPYCKVWPGHFRLPLPAIPIPLTPPHPDITLELQPLVEGIYARARYHLRLDYTRPLAPPLGDDESAWLADALRQRVS